MITHRLLPAMGILLVSLLVAQTQSAEPATKQAKPEREQLLFDFENADDAKAWTNLELPDPADKETKKPVKHSEPAAKIELSNEHATSGKQSLKITFAGGKWPTVFTTKVFDDWVPFESLRADVTVSRSCVIGFTALQEKSTRGQGWEDLVSRWTKTEFLRPGTNAIDVPLRMSANPYSIDAKFGKVIRFEIFMYHPEVGESIYIDNVRLSTVKPKSGKMIEFTVAGTDIKVSAPSSANAVQALAKQRKDQWVKPDQKSLAQVEEEFRGTYQELKKKHPEAVLAVLRDGEKGYDPAHPDKVYAGWKDAYWNSHGPDSNNEERARNRGKEERHEIFMRHRSPLMQVDLSSIPNGSEILAARLILIRANDNYEKERDPRSNPNLWVAEPCNRPWNEYEVNAFEYARNKFWKDIGGWYYGEDPDFLPTFLAMGPGQGKVNSWDFTTAVRFWTRGKNPNHGFMMHANGGDYLMGHSREAKEVKDRPAVLVIYKPK